jgi:tRNA pseudouridine55 synthase
VAQSSLTDKLEGILPVHKPAGMTSHDVVARIRRYYKMKRVGHTGTLDPAVTGVLPICLGRATRMVEYIQELPKEYEAELILGAATDTEDATGNVIQRQEVPPLAETDIEEQLQAFVGEIDQVPPMYSAIKIDGKRLYELARSGKEVERKSRKVTIYRIEALEYNLKDKLPSFRFRVQCSKGTYIRTLCVDIGKALGYPAHMGTLVRTATGPFQLKDCFSLEDIAQSVEEERGGSLLQPVELAVAHLPRAVFIEERPDEVYHGKTLGLSRFRFEPGQSIPDAESTVAVFSNEGVFLAIYLYQPGNPWLKPIKVFS